MEHKALGTRKLEQTTSNLDVDAHLSNKEVSTNTFLQVATVNEEIAETNTKEIERIKIGSNKICVRKDLAKENKHDVQPRIEPSYLRDGERGSR